MRRIIGSAVVGLVAAPAIPAAQAVVAVDMALGALQAGMRARQGEPGRRVVKGGAGPVKSRGSMANGAVLREAGGFVRRVGGSVEVVLVAAPAGRAAQSVVIIDVARGALLGGVEAHQGEARGGVVKGGAVPICRGVTPGAILREVGRLMRRTVGSVVVGLVTVPASCRGQAVVVVHVALDALHAGVRASQREPGRRMVKRGAGPVDG